MTVRSGQQLDTRIDAPTEVDGPVTRGDRLGTVVVSVGGEPAARAPLEATSSAAAASLVERYDAAVPGPRAFAWVLAIAAIAAIGIGAVAVWDRRR